MSPQLRAIISKAKGLSPEEQIELINAISQSLQNKLPEAKEFWQSRSLQELYKKQPVQVFQNIDDFASDFWPKEESTDEFIEFIWKQRHEDLLEN